MQTENELTLEERVARLETTVAAIAAHLDGSAARPDRSPGPRQTARPAPRNPEQPHPLASKSAEWWLARGGAGLTCVALVLLYQYAVDRNWITPIVRIVMGTSIGAALMWWGFRIPRDAKNAPQDTVGFREVLLGAGLSAWYITAYAAAVFYQLTSLSTARWLFVVLSIAGAWLALREKRAILAILALGVGFATPALLPSESPSIPAFAVYLAALTAVGLVLYLMRGWQSVLWLTFGAFWWLAGLAAALSPFVPARVTGSATAAHIAMTLLLLAAGATFVRVPVLRRRLVALQSDLYTEPRQSAAVESLQREVANALERLTGQKAAIDSLPLWIVTVASPLLAIVDLAIVWRGSPSILWGLSALAMAAFGYRLAMSSRPSGSEVAHVEVTAAAIWSLAGIFWLADAFGSSLFPSSSLALMGPSLHAFAMLSFSARFDFTAPRRIGFLTAFVALFVVIVWEGIVSGGLIESVWTIAELSVVALSLWIWWTLRATDMMKGRLFGLGAYVGLMLIDARVLGSIWSPLVTASYAVAGAVLLIVGRRGADRTMMRQLGGITLVVVVARLVMVDLAAVETIWRVLLFLGCGALFLVTSRHLQSTRDAPPPEPAR
ncbi:MAG: DUF2339 domain-containing protein [Gemmatimonadales bacterium]